MNVWTPEAVAEAAMEHKGKAVADGDEMHSMLLIDTTTSGPAIVPWPYSTLDLEDAAMALSTLDITEACFVSDAYGLVAEAKARPQHLFRGALAQRFAEGDPEVCETLTIYCMERSGYCTLMFVNYKMIDGMPVYDDPIQQDSMAAEAHGTVPDALRTLVRAS